MSNSASTILCGWWPAIATARVPSPHSCRICHGLVFAHFPDGQPQPLHYSTTAFLDLQQSSSHGCQVCKLLYQALEHIIGSSARATITTGNRLPLLRLYSNVSESLGTVEIYSAKPGVKAWGFIPPCPEVSGHPGAAQALSFITAQISDCMLTHTACESVRSVIPTRLILVGLPGSSLKLIEPGPSDNFRYAALSHCWGGSPVLRLERSTEQWLKTSITETDLPRAYRDAVTLCRQLKIPLLWIDSLCIMQDDRDEWNREAAKMADVYECAFLTICASSSASTDDTFLAPYTHSQYEPTVLVWSDQEEKDPLIKSRRPCRTGRHSTCATDPLDTRAWAFQEQQMASRSVSFTSDELQWSCKTQSTCECMKGLGSVVEGPSFSLYHRLQSSTNLLRGASRSLSDFWHSTVAGYSGRQLTYATDRLPAISGLAAKYQQLSGHRYVAGLWKETLLEDMLWVCEAHPSYARPSEYLAPTFSWASITGPVSFPEFDPNSTYHTTVVDVHTSLNNSNNPLGEVIDGYVTLEGPVFQASFSRLNGLETPLLKFPCSKPTYSFRPDASIVPGSHLQSSQSNGTAQQASEGDRRPEYGPVSCLIVRCSYPYRVHYPYKVHCLVLGLSRRPSSAYERLGLLLLNCQDMIGGEAWLKSVPISRVKIY